MAVCQRLAILDLPRRSWELGCSELPAEDRILCGRQGGQRSGFPTIATMVAICAHRSGAGQLTVKRATE